MERAHLSVMGGFGCIFVPTQQGERGTEEKEAGEKDLG